MSNYIPFDLGDDYYQSPSFGQRPTPYRPAPRTAPAVYPDVEKSDANGFGIAPGLLLGAGGAALAAYGIGNAPSGDYDPERLALKHYRELTDPSSGYYRKLGGFYRKLLSNSQPTVDTMYGFNKSAGINDSSATALSAYKAREMVARSTNAVTDEIDREFRNNNAIAQQYLQMEFGRARDAQGNQGSLSNELIGLGGGILGKLIGGLF